MKFISNVKVLATCAVLGFAAWSAAHAQVVQVATANPIAGKISYTNYNNGYGVVYANLANDSTAALNNLIEITPVPAGAGYRFLYWSGAPFNAGGALLGQERNSPLFFFHNGSTYNIIANFGLPPTLDVIANAPGRGTVRFNNITDGNVSLYANAVQDTSADKNDSIQISALAASGYRFDHWEGNVPGGQAYANPASIVGTGSNMNVTAMFVPSAKISLTVNSAALGDVAITNHTDGVGDGPADNVQDPASDDGDSITIRAIRAIGGKFANWSGDIPGGLANANPATFVSDGTTRNIAANFTTAPKITVSANDYALGDVSITNATDHTSAGPADSVTDPEADNADSITVRAYPEPGRVFIRWVGGPVNGGAANPATFPATGADISITAEFGDPAKIVVSVNVGALGDVIITNLNTHQSVGPADFVVCAPANNLDIIRITAIPSSTAYRFVRWNGDVAAAMVNNNPLVFSTDGLNKNISATFDVPTAKIQVSVDPGVGFPGAGTGLASITNLTRGTYAPPGNPAIIGVEVGDQVILLPVPDPGFVFYRWGGDIVAGQQYVNPLTFLSVGVDQNITVLFSNGDLDGDGLSDTWERQNGLDPEDPSGLNGGGGDPDDDDLSNLEEFLGPENGNISGINPVPNFASTNPRDDDTDGDGMNDGWEAYYGLDPRDATGNNGRNGDVDGDTLYATAAHTPPPLRWMRNYDEYVGADGIAPVGVGLGEDSTDPQAFDTDGDLLGDGWEVYYVLDALDPNDPNGTRHNQDEDYLPGVPAYVYPQVPLDVVNGYSPSVDDPFDNLYEYVGFDLIRDTVDDPHTDPKDPDSDDDNLPDGWEYYFYGNAINNPAMVGRAFDPATMTGSVVIANATILAWFNPTVNNGAANADPDRDCLTNIEEFRLGTDPINWDTDNDGMPDGWENTYGLDPLDRNDAAGNPDNDWMADDGNGNIHNRVYQALGYDPRTAWGPRFMANCGIGVAGALGTNTVNTRPFTSLDEFLLSAYYFAANTNLGGVGCTNWINYTTDPTKIDTDGDGIADGWELYVGLNPTAIRGVTDGGADSDGDGLSNVQEFRCMNLAAIYPTDFPMVQPLWVNKGWPTDPNDGDTDGDFVGDGGEFGAFLYGNGSLAQQGACYIGGGLNPTAADTDGDWLPDPWEVYYQGAGGTTAVLRTGMDGTISDATGLQNDYDLDGLENYQEYWGNATYHWHYDPRIPPSWSPGQGFGGYDPVDFFVPPYGKQPYPWDCRYLVSPCQYFFYITPRTTPPGAPPRTGPPGLGDYASMDPRDWDTDWDLMDDYYECYHGLNPLWGSIDIVHAGIPASVPFGLDVRVWPFLNGSQAADSDQDGLTNDKESLDPNRPDPQYYHTDPSPLWLTDHSYQLSWVNLYYWLGSMTSAFYWLGGSPAFCGPVPPPAYIYSFESVEGFDTDNDNIADHDDLVGTDIAGSTDPIDEELPIRRRALKLNGDAAARTRGSFYHNNTVLENFTVELWARPDNPATGLKQVLIERPFFAPNNNPMGWLEGIRLNFRIGLDENGMPFGEYNGSGYDPTTVDPIVKGVVPLQANQWYHLALVYNGTDQKLKLYVNGNLANSIPSALVPYNGWFNGSPGWVLQGPIVVGARDYNPNGFVSGTIILTGPCAGLYPGCSLVPNEPNLAWFYSGWVDEVRIWDGARTETQIRDLMMVRLKRNTALPMMQTYPQLFYHYTFDDLPDPDYDPVSPEGFKNLNGFPNDGSYPAVPWWFQAKDKTLVYDDYRYIPWIPNTVAHIPIDPTADSPYWPVLLYDAAGNINGTNLFPNSSNPYNMGYFHNVNELFADHPDYDVSFRLIYRSVESALFNDMLPLRYAEADEDVVMWDGLGSGTNMLYDTDGDGLPDMWEIQYGLDPLNDTGEDGMMGDPDHDGLPNYAEFISNTDPLDFDTDDNGIGDYDSRACATCRTYGELHTDGDGIDDGWEVLYPQAMSPLLYDADKDPDGDGWSNFAEFMADTDPSDKLQYPQPDAYIRVDYSGINDAGELLIQAYNSPAMDGLPDATYSPQALPALTVNGEPLAASGSLFYALRLDNGNIIPQTLQITDANHTLLDVGGGTLISTWPSSQGTINYATGDLTINYTNAPPAGYMMTASYSYRANLTSYPQDLFYTNAFVGRVREGKNWFFAFIDQDGSRNWTPGEPCGLAQGYTKPSEKLPHEAVDVGWDRFYLKVSLTDNLPGYGRFLWGGVGADIRKVTIRRNSSQNQPIILTRQMKAPRNFFHEGDFRLAGQFGADAGGLMTSLYESLIDDVRNAYFTNSWPSSLASPTLVSPLGNNLVYAENDVTFAMDRRTTWFEVQIAKPAEPTRPILYNRYVPPHRNGSGEYKFTLPWFAGDGTLVNGSYVWRVRGFNPYSYGGGAWSGFGSFNLNLQNTVQGAHSIQGAIYYFGQIQPPSIVVQAFKSAGFSGRPAAQVTLSPSGMGPNYGAFGLLGLRAGVYYVRAFIDQDGDKQLDPFESFGFVKDTGSQFATDYKPQALAIPINLTGKTLVIRDRDTDNDNLADSWEYATYGSITARP